MPDFIVFGSIFCVLKVPVTTTEEDTYGLMVFLNLVVNKAFYNMGIVCQQMIPM